MNIRGVPALTWLKDSWRPLVALASSLGATFFGFFPSLVKINPLAPLSLAVSAVILMVWNLQRSETPLKLYLGGMQDACHDIAAEIAFAAARDSQLLVRISGCRMRHIRIVLERIIDTIPMNVTFEIFHAAEEYLRTGPWSTAERDATDVSQSRTDLQSLLGDRVRFVEYRQPPVFYAYFIADRALFLGLFQFKRKRDTWEGPKNPCYRLRPSDPLYGFLAPLVLTRLDLWSAGSPNTEPQADA